MKSISIYCKTSGQYKRTISCQDDLLQSQVFDGEAGFVDREDPEQHVLVGTYLKRVGPRPFDGATYSTRLMQWVDDRPQEVLWAAARAKRRGLLESSDWTQLSDVPSQTKEAWRTYRQALRDITKQPDPRNLIWPDAPA